MNNELDKYGALLLNMGGPGSLDEVEDYIYELLADPEMIKLPLAFLLQKPFARMVSRRRAPKVRQRYEMIGGRSPIAAETAEQARLLGDQLRLPVEFAMRYTPPTATEAIIKLAAQGAKRLIVIPLYPQFSTVSTSSAITDLVRRLAELRRSGELVEYRLIDRHYNDGNYIHAMCQALINVLVFARTDLKTHLLFAAHSIPESYITSGDPYADEVEQTMALIIHALGKDMPYSLAYQSRVGPVKWRGPTLDEELATLVDAGVEQIVVQPLSFVSENLETLFDLDIDFRESCKRAGIQSMLRVPTLSASPHYINALAAMTRREIAAWEANDA